MNVREVQPVRGVRSATVGIAGLVLLLGSVSTSAQVRINNRPELPGAVLGRTYSVQLVAGGGAEPYQFAIVSGNLPTGVNVSPTGLISGTVTTGGAYFAGIRVTDSRNETIVKDFRLTVHGLPVNVVLESRLDVPVGVPLRKTISANGGAGAPYRISYLSGTLPPGLNFLKQNGPVSQAVLSGTPLREGIYSATFEARDSGGRLDTATMVINVQPNPIRIAPFALPAGITGEEYEFDIPVQQGFSPVRCLSAAALPPGLTITAGCRVRGLVMAPATLDLRAALADGAGGSAFASGLAQFNVPSRLTIATANILPSGAVGQPYRKQLVLQGSLTSPTTVSAVPRWTVTSGILPPGLRLDTNTGTITGTPTTPGPFRFTSEYAGPEGSAIKTFDITVGAQPYIWESPSEFGPLGAGIVASLPTGSFRGGVPAVRHHLVSGAWPPGMAPQDDGTLAGTPLAAGTYTFTMESKATDGQVVSKDFRVIVLPALPLAIRTNTPNLPDAIAGVPYFFADYAPGCSCDANQGTHPYRWQEELSSVSSLPVGLTLRADGELSGTPSTPGTYSFPLILSDASGRSVSQRYTLRVLDFVGTMSLLPTPPLPAATVGLPFTAQFATSGGTAPIAFSPASPLPPFLTLSPAGVLSSSGPALGSHQVTLTARDSQPENLGGPLSVTRTYDLLVTTPLPPVITRLEPPSVPAGRPALQLSVFGSGFTRDSIGFLDGTRRVATILEPGGSLRLEIPASVMQQPGVLRVTIVNGNQISNAADFVILGAGPQITLLQPASAQAGGPAFVLTAAGSNFQSGTVVRWNGTPLPTSFVSGNSVTANVAANLIAGAGLASVTAVNPDGQTSPAAIFTIAARAPAPQITTLNPPTAQAGAAGFELTVSGSNFQAGATVRWNGAALSTVFVSATQLAAGVTANLIAAAGPVDVTVANPDSQISLPAVFQVSQPAAPRITSLNPPSAQAGGAAFTLAVNGANFVSGAVVRWNESPLSTVFGSASLLTANVPASLIVSAGSANVTVVNPDAQISVVAAFPISPAPSPVISALTPPSVPAGGPAFLLTVGGSNFQSGAVVKWNGTDIATTFSSASQLTVNVAAGLIANPGSAVVSVANPDGQTSLTAVFTITAQPPQISSLAPSSAQAGSVAFTLSVNGSFFQSGATVRWNGAALPTTFVSATQINATVAANLISAAGSPSITAANPDGQVSQPAAFTITQAPAPQISSLNPPSAHAGTAGFALTIQGSNFTAGSAVTWNGASLQTAFVSAAQLTAAIPASLIASPGSPSVRVANPDGQASAAAPFLIELAPRPDIVSLSPASAIVRSPGFTLTITGRNFQNNAAVTWNAAALVTTFVSATQLTAAVPAGFLASAGAVNIVVANPDGQSTAPASFTVAQRVPQITALTPSSAQASGPGFVLTIRGADFAQGTRALWNGSPLATTLLSDVELSATVPAALIAAAGTASITAANSDGQTSAASIFTIMPAPAPAITALNPNTIRAASTAFDLTIQGANFQNGAVVRWNGTALATTFNSATRLTARITENLIGAAGSASIAVANPDGQTSASSNFIITQAPPPQITSLSPGSAQAGAESFRLIVTGSDFQNGAAVRWNGTPLATTPLSENQLSASIAAALIANAGAASVTVANPDAQVSSPLVFTISAPPPQITLLTPGSVQAGAQAFTLAVQGTNFQSGAVVRWNDSPLPTTFASANQITAAVAANLFTSAGTASISVSNPDGQNSAPVNFSIGSAPAPLVTALSPNTAVAGSAGFVITVQGANFHLQATVKWNGTALTLNQTSTTQITAMVPAALVASVGAANIVVTSPDGQASTPAAFTIVAPPPQIISLSPGSVQALSAAFTLRVNGTGFQSGAVVRWSGSPIATTFVSASQLNASIPANLVEQTGVAAISVRNPDNQVSSESTFSIGAPPRPVITGVAPGSLLAGSTTTSIAISGSNFVSGSVVAWSGTQLATSFSSSTQLTAVVQTSLLGAPAAVSLTARNPDGQVSDAFIFSVTAQPPSILSLSPSSAVAGGAEFSLIVGGQNFRAGAEVRWNGSPLATSQISAGQVIALVPSTQIASPGNPLITVRNSDGSTSNAVTFAVLNAAPQVSGLAPAAIAAGSAAFPLTVAGANFVRETLVLWNGSPLPTTFLNSTQVTAQVAAEMVARAGVANVAVRNAETQISNSQRFTISEPSTPEITRLNPASAAVNSPAFQLAVTGSNFQNESQVIWNNIALFTNYVSATQLTANVPASLLLVKGSVPITVRNSGGRTSQPAAFDIGDALQLTSTQNLPDGQVGVGYRGELLAAGGTKPYRWGVVAGSNLPAGIELTTDGNLQGTPTAAGETFFDIEVRDAASGADRRRFRLLIVRTLEISSTSPLPKGTAGDPYSFRFQTSEPAADAVWTLLDGEVPAGVALNPVTGELAGIPQEPSEEDEQPRAFRFRVEVTAGSRQARKSFDLTIDPARNGFRIATESPLTEARIGRPYQTRIAAVGGRLPYSFTVTAGALPSGLTFTLDGAIEGTPQVAGTFTFSVRALDARQRVASQELSLVVADIPGPEITSAPTLPSGTPGQPYSFQIQATGGRLPYRWSLISGALTPGVSFDPSQSRVTGIPERAGLFRFTVRVTDADNRADARMFELPVLLLGDELLQFTTTSLPAPLLGQPYRAPLAASGGSVPYRFLLRSGSLPPGLRLEGAAIVGTTTDPGSYAFGLRVVDSAGAQADRNFVVDVNLAPLPAVTIGGISDTINPGQQAQVAVDLSSAYPMDLQGRLEIDFTSEPEVQGIDPALQFSTGGRVVEFRVPAGQTRAIFPQTPFGLQTGTMAGLMRIRVILRVAGREMRAANEPDRVIRIAQIAPVISSASIERIAGGFNVIVVGFSSTREVLEGMAILNPAPGRLIESTRLVVPLNGAFKTWYDTTMSLAFGTQFRLVLPFNGDPASVESLTFVLRNARGMSNEVRLSF